MCTSILLNGLRMPPGLTRSRLGRGGGPSCLRPRCTARSMKRRMPRSLRPSRGASCAGSACPGRRWSSFSPKTGCFTRMTGSCCSRLSNFASSNRGLRCPRASPARRSSGSACRSSCAWKPLFLACSREGGTKSRMMCPVRGESTRATSCTPTSSGCSLSRRRQTCRLSARGASMRFLLR